MIDLEGVLVRWASNSFVHPPYISLHLLLWQGAVQVGPRRRDEITERASKHCKYLPQSTCLRW